MTIHKQIHHGSLVLYVLVVLVWFRQFKHLICIECLFEFFRL